MNHLTSDHVHFCVCNIGMMNFVFIILFDDGEDIVHKNGEAIFVVCNEDLQDVINCEDVKFVPFGVPTTFQDGVMTIGVPKSLENITTLGDIGECHFCLIRTTHGGGGELSRQIEGYIERFDDIDNFEDFEDYSLLSEPDFMKFKRIKDDTEGIGIAAMKHPVNPKLVALGIIVSDRCLADIDEHGKAVINVTDMSHLFGNEFTQVIVTKNLRIAKKVSYDADRGTLVLALPKFICQMKHEAKHFTDINGWTFCMIRVHHTRDIPRITGKSSFNPEVN